jgi:hypothetical protein
MRKNRQSRFDWRKPRFHRSDPNIIRGKAAKNLKTNTGGRITATDHCTRWKIPISRETFDELVARGVLSDEQIEQYLRREAEKSKAKKRKTATSKAKKHKDFALIVEISKLNLKTIEGAEALNKLIKKRPEALSLIGEAQKLRAAK